MGMQNTPDRNTWRADQRLMSSPTHRYDDDDDDEIKTTSYVLEMLYDTDRTGMLQIELISNNDDDSGEIRLYRCGSRPSTSYLMQESLIVDGLLNELQHISGLDGGTTDDRTARSAVTTTTASTTTTTAGTSLEQVEKEE